MSHEPLSVTWARNLCLLRYNNNWFTTLIILARIFIFTMKFLTTITFDKPENMPLLTHDTKRIATQNIMQSSSQLYLLKRAALDSTFLTWEDVGRSS